MTEYPPWVAGDVRAKLTASSSGIWSNGKTFGFDPKDVGSTPAIPIYGECYDKFQADTKCLLCNHIGRNDVSLPTLRENIRFLYHLSFWRTADSADLFVRI